MLKVNYIKVIIPQQFDFKLYGIDNEEDKQKFLQKMCKEAINAPIVQNEKAIGVITESKISKTGNGIICGGNIWCDIGFELFKRDSEYSFSCTTIETKS
jgi:predicted transcriptional regulator